MADNLCKSCNQPISGNFCANCGEKNSGKRLTVKDLFSDFMSNLFELEFPLMRTVVGLTIRPGKMVREYVEGKRRPYYKPFQYYILTIALFYLVFYASGLKMSDYSAGFSPEFPEGEAADLANILNDQIGRLMNEHARLIQFVIIPITTLYSWLLFRKSGFNGTENFVANLYFAAHASLIGLLCIPLSFVDFKVYFTVSGITAMIYQFWGYKQFFQVKPLTALMRGLLVWIFTFITFGIINMIVTILIMRLFGNFHVT